METLISFLAGALAAAVLTTIFYRSRIRQAETDAENRLDADFRAERAKLEADLTNGKVNADALREQIRQMKTEYAESLAMSKAELKRQYQEDIDFREKTHREALAALQERFDETVAKVTAQMKAESSDMMKERQKEFAEASNRTLGQILNPLNEKIAELKETMAKGNVDQAKMAGEMGEQIRNLMAHSEAARKSADDLAAAFKHGSKIQGDWGETILEELLQAQGLTPGVHFDIQPTLRDSDGNVLKGPEGNSMRPDVILHLDQKREVVIDSKVSLSAYVDYVNADNEPDRQRFLKAHLDSIRSHVKELSKKRYADYIKSPKVSAGYVIMFVPHAGALWTALNAEPDLWRKAADDNVYIADEQSLYGALKIVKLTWTQVAQAKNHEEIYALADQMIERVGFFLENYRKVGTAIRNAAQAYEDSSKKLTMGGQSVMTTASNLLKMGAKNSSRHKIPSEYLDVDDIPPIEETRADADVIGFGS